VHRFDMRGAVVSAAHPSRAGSEPGQICERLGSRAGGNRREPGLRGDKLLITLAAVSQRIEHAKALRGGDASKRRLPLQKKIGAGMTEEEFRAQVKAGVIKHVGLPESVAMIADSLNLPVDEITETIEPKIATERVQTDYLTVEAGQAAGVHQIARGVGGGGSGRGGCHGVSFQGRVNSEYRSAPCRVGRRPQFGGRVEEALRDIE